MIHKSGNQNQHLLSSRIGPSIDGTFPLWSSGESHGRAATSPPHMLIDGLQISWGKRTLSPPPYKRKSQPTSKTTNQYFPNTRIFTHDRTLWAGKTAGKQARLRITGSTLLRHSLKMPQPKNKTNEGVERAAHNFLDQEEQKKLQSALAQGLRPIDFILEALELGLHEVTKEIENLAAPYSSISNSMPAFIYRVEFCRDYGPYSTTSATHLEENFKRAAAQQDGFLYTERDWKNGSCPRVRVSPRISKKERYGAKERTFIKVYRKCPDMIRAEVTYEYPLASKPLLLPSDVSEELRLIAADAEVRLDLLHKDLCLIKKAEFLPEIDIQAQLIKYGLIAPANNLRLVELCRQISELGLYDPAILPIGQRVRRESLREKIAHPNWGILKKRKRDPRTGASGTPFYVLRADWKTAAANYPGPPAARPTPIGTIPHELLLEITYWLRINSKHLDRTQKTFLRQLITELWRRIVKNFWERLRYIRNARHTEELPQNQSQPTKSSIEEYLK